MIGLNYDVLFAYVNTNKTTCFLFADTTRKRELRHRHMWSHSFQTICKSYQILDSLMCNSLSNDQATTCTCNKMLTINPNNYIIASYQIN